MARKKKIFNPSHISFDGVDWSLASIEGLSREDFEKKCMKYPLFRKDPQRDKRIEAHWNKLQSHFPKKAEEKNKGL